jgi:hypothetical protein
MSKRGRDESSPSRSSKRRKDTHSPDRVSGSDDERRHRRHSRSRSRSPSRHKDKRDRKHKDKDKHKHKDKDRHKHKKDKHKKDKHKDKKRMELLEKAKQLVQQADAPPAKDQITHISQANDYYTRNTEFSLWLKADKGIYFADLNREAAGSYFDEFADAWNNARLPGMPCSLAASNAHRRNVAHVVLYAIY